MTNPIEINDYDVFKDQLNSLDDQKEITFEKEGENFVYEINGKEYSLNEMYKNYIDTYKETNEKLQIQINTVEATEELKKEVEMTSKIDGYITTFEKFLEDTSWRQRHNPFDKKYKGSQYRQVRRRLWDVHRIVRKQLIQLESAKKYISEDPTNAVVNYPDFDAYERSADSMQTFLTKASFSELDADLDIIVNNLKDTKLYDKFQEEMIDYKEEFNGILSELAKDKLKLKEYDRISQYFQDVINGKIDEPAKNPFKCKYRDDYTYLAALQSKYAHIGIIVLSPDADETVTSRTSTWTTSNKETANTGTEEINIEGDTFQEKMGNAFEKGGLISAVWVGLESLVEAAGVDVNLTPKQKQTMRLVGIGAGIYGLYRVFKRWKKKRNDAGKGMRGPVLGLAAAEWFGHSMGRGGLVSNTLGLVFSKNPTWGDEVGDFIKDGFSLKDALETERKGESRPITTMLAVGNTTPANGVLTVNNGTFDLNKDAMELERDMESDSEIKKNMEDNFNDIYEQDNRQEILKKSLDKLGITQADIENPANADKTFLEIAADKKEGLDNRAAQLDSDLKKKGYIINDPKFYNVYLDYEVGDDIEKKIEDWEEEGYIIYVSDTSVEDYSDKEIDIALFANKYNLKPIDSQIDTIKDTLPEGETALNTELEKLRTIDPAYFEYNYAKSENILMKNRDGTDPIKYGEQLKTQIQTNNIDLKIDQYEAIVGMCNMMEKRYDRRYALSFDSLGNLVVKDPSSAAKVEYKLDINNLTMPGFEEDGKAIKFNSIEDMLDTCSYSMFMTELFPKGSSKNKDPFETSIRNGISSTKQLTYEIDESRAKNKRESLKQWGLDRYDATKADGIRWWIKRLGPALIPYVGLPYVIRDSSEYFTNKDHWEDYYGTDADGNNPSIPTRLVQANENPSAYANYLNNLTATDGSSYFTGSTT